MAEPTPTAMAVAEQIIAASRTRLMTQQWREVGALIAAAYDLGTKNPVKPAQPDPLAVIETTNAIADVLDGVKTAMLSRGWDDRTAESAAIMVFQVERLKG